MFLHAGNLAPDGGYYEQTQTVALPEGISGPYYIFVQADYQNVVFENGSESNNTARGDITIALQPTPDLQVAQVDAADGASGQPVSVTWTVTNQGTGTLAGAWHDALFLSADPVYGAGDTFLGSFAVSGILPVGGQYQRTESVTLPVTFYPPDLEPAITAAPTTGVGGQAADIHWTVTNAGTGDSRSGSWYDRVYLSTSSMLDIGSATLLASVLHTGVLGAGDSYDASHAVTLPLRAEGPYFLFVVTDAPAVPELSADRADDVSAPAAITVAAPPTANLAVTASAPASAFPGLAIDVTWTVTNSGAAATTAGQWYDDVYLSHDDSLATAADNILLGRFLRSGDLGAGGHPYTRTESLTVPSNILGTYHVLVVTDSLDGVYEHAGEGDNTSAPVAVNVTVPVADLAVVSVDAPAAAWSGQAVTLDWLVTNVGSQPTSAASWTDRVYLSTDETLSGDDLQVLQVNHVGALGAGGSYQQHVSITLSDSAVGPYYVFVVADALGGVSDSNLSNNTGHDAQAMVVSQTPPPDLVVTSLQAPAEAWSGQGLTLQWTVTNSGAGGTPTDRWTDSVVLSTDDVLGNGDDVALGSFAHYGVLAAGTGYTQSQTVALPSNAGGAWHVFVVTDAGNRVTETAEGNNSAGQPVLVHVSPSPDLRVTLVQADPASVQSGSATTLTWTVLNDSSAATPGGYW